MDCVSLLQSPIPYTLLKRTPLAGGLLEVLAWEGSRKLRVWLPPGYSPLDVSRGDAYPVLYLNDGQNLFGKGVMAGWVDCSVGLFLG